MTNAPSFASALYPIRVEVHFTIDRSVAVGTIADVRRCMCSTRTLLSSISLKAFWKIQIAEFLFTARSRIASVFYDIMEYRAAWLSLCTYIISFCFKVIRKLSDMARIQEQFFFDTAAVKLEMS